MDSRRDFLKKAALLSGAGLTSMFPPSVQRAMAINPAAGSTFLDAEHVVILMQENRSFDHCFGTLQGVRGFNDPRAIHLPNNNIVFLQSNAKGETYAPFRLNIKDTKATWMGSLPHGWTDQVDARNNGKHDQWLEAKKSGHKEYKNMPLTLGYYNREDLPFYHSLADAFTVCDQNFCSSLTGTTPNRSYLWTGTIRESATTQARVRNSELDYEVEASWTTFPERLEDNFISWRIYQNEISVGNGLNGDEDAWLSNFTDNPIEWFSQYSVRYLPAYMKFIPKKIELLKQEIADLEKKTETLPSGEELVRTHQRLAQRRKSLEATIEEKEIYTPENYKKIGDKEQNLHEKAFTTNVNDPDYHSLTTIKYTEGAEEREVLVPKGDVLHQFREDVKNGKLPTVSWLVAPENFSDHPGAPWYGAWYVSETMDILTQNPEVWKKTIFILCYDENDGYFDHVPPFVPPHPTKANTGLMSKGLDAQTEYVMLEDDLKRQPASYARESPIGLGYRVPLLIASPWSRGGKVNSEVCDHTSILRFLEKFLKHKTGKAIVEDNISAWRRTVCGDLTSVFSPYNGENIALPNFLGRNNVVENIHRAKFKKDPEGFMALSPDEIDSVNKKVAGSSILPRQEKGVRKASALPYELYAECALTKDGKAVTVKLNTGKEIYGEKSSGSPFHIYDHGGHARAYAVVAGDQLIDSWPSSDFPPQGYHLNVYGPNGFFREFRGSVNDPQVDVACRYEKQRKSFSGNVIVSVKNNGTQAVTLSITDNGYKSKPQTKSVGAGSTVDIPFDLKKNFSWYDLSVRVDGVNGFERRYAGKVENGKEGFTDPLMGGIYSV